jgi:small nuclear ribonucleoprotein (snRNP)-like protein
MGMNFSLFDDVTELRIDLAMSGGMVLDIDFNTITITDEQAVTGSIVAFLNYENITLQALSVNYNGNGNTGGAVAVDGNTYHITDTVTVLGNTGSLVKAGSTFSGWNTGADGTGASYDPGQTFSMPAAGVTLYARYSQAISTLSERGMIPLCLVLGGVALCRLSRKKMAV